MRGGILFEDDLAELAIVVMDGDEPDVDAFGFAGGPTRCHNFLISRS